LENPAITAVEMKVTGADRPKVGFDGNTEIGRKQ
jgi:hypothetical protein